MDFRIALLLLPLLASCATNRPPKPPLVPRVEVETIDTADLERSARETRNAIREVVRAGEETRDTAAALTAEIDRARELAQQNEGLRLAFEKIQQAAKRLEVALMGAQAKERGALDVIDEQDAQISNLKATVAKQKAQIEQAGKVDESLRAQVEELSSVSADLAIAKDRLSWWRKAAFITWGCVVLAALILYGPGLLRRTILPYP